MLILPIFLPSSRKCCCKCDCDCDSLLYYSSFTQMTKGEKISFALLIIFCLSLMPSTWLIQDLFRNLASYDDEIKVIHHLSQKEPKLFEYLKENDFHEQGFSTPDKNSYSIDKIDLFFFIEPTFENLLNKYFSEYNASDLSDLYDKITPKPYFDNSDINYFAQYSLSEKVAEFMESNGILSIYEYNMLEAMVEKAPIIEEEILLGLKTYRNHPIIEELYKIHSFQGYIPKYSKHHAYSALEEVLKLEFSEMDNNNPNDHFSPAYEFQISEINEYFQEYKNEKIQILYKKYTLDDFLSYAEASFIIDLFEEYENELEAESQAPDYIQNAAKYAIKNNFLTKNKIEEEIEKYGFIRNSFSDTLVTIFALNKFKYCFLHDRNMPNTYSKC